MSTPVKLLLFLLGLLLTVMIAVAVFIQTQLTPDRLREQLLPYLEQKLERQIAFSAIDIGLFSGVSVSDFSIRQKDAEQDFISVSALNLEYRLWSLLRGQLVIDRIMLEQPRILITRYQDGSFNFSDLLAATAKAESGKDPAGSAAPAATVKIPLRLLMKQVDIVDGHVELTDQLRSALSPYRYRLENLAFKARRITLDDSFPVDLSAVLNGAQVDISGHYNISERRGDWIIHNAPLDIIQFAPYYRNLVPLKLGSGTLATNLEVELNADQLTSKGRLQLTNLDLAVAKRRDFSVKQAELAADYSLAYDLSGKQLDVTTLMLTLNGMSVSLEGRVDLNAADPVLRAGSIVFEQLDLRRFMDNLPQPLAKDLRRYSLAGQVSGRFAVAGKLSSGTALLQQAEVNLADVSFSKQNFRVGLSGALDYVDGALDAGGLRIDYGELAGRLNFHLDNVWRRPLTGVFSLEADVVDLNKVFPEKAVSPGETKTLVAVRPQQKPVASASAAEVGPFSLPVDLHGRVAVKQLDFRRSSLQDVSGELSLRNNRLDLLHLTATANGGEIDASALFDLGVPGLAYQGEFKVLQPNVGPLLDTLFPASGTTVSGQMLWRSSFSGRGVRAQQVLDRLSAQGEFHIIQGLVEGLPLLNRLALFIGADDFKVLSFQSLNGRYRLNNGSAQVNAALDGSKAELRPQGSIGSNGRLNLKLDTRLAPELISKLGTGGSLKQALIDQQGWGVLPLRITGTAGQPEIAFDGDALQQQLLENAKRKAEERLLDKSAPEKESQQPMRQLLDSTLNKLFGQ